MDWITQAALGAAIGELILGKRLGNRALAWGALLGVLPDLIGSITPYMDTARGLWWSRGMTHCIWIIGLGSWGAANLLSRLWTRDKILKSEAGMFIFAIWLAHVAADCLTTAGAMILWPFSIKPVSFNLLQPMDPFFAGPLVITVIWMACIRDQKMKKARGKKNSPLSKRRKISYWGLGLCAGYLLLVLGFKLLVSAGFEADLNRRGTKWARRMDTPMPFNPLLWRAVIDRGDEFWIGYRTIFEFHTTPVRWTVYMKGSENLAGVAELRETKTLSGTTNGWWLARPNAKGAWLADIRFPEIRIWGNKKTMVDSRFERSWIIDSKADRDRLQKVYAGDYPTGDYYSRMVGRTFGNREGWEANPRLAGTKSLPEFLPVEE